MSVTFQLDMDTGVRPGWALDEEPTDAQLENYYAARESWGEFNVSNSNAGYILRDLLGLEQPESWGSLSQDEFLYRLSHLEPMSVVGGIVPLEREENFVSCGRSVSQCDRYVAKLVQLGQLAQKHGCGISWG